MWADVDDRVSPPTLDSAHTHTTTQWHPSCVSARWRWGASAVSHYWRKCTFLFGRGDHIGWWKAEKPLLRRWLHAALLTRWWQRGWVRGTDCSGEKEHKSPNETPWYTTEATQRHLCLRPGLRMTPRKCYLHGTHALCRFITVPPLPRTVYPKEYKYFYWLLEICILLKLIL